MKMKLLLSYKLMNSNNVNSVHEMTKVRSDTSRETATALESSLHLFSPIRERVLFIFLCTIRFVILVFLAMPFSYLSLYNEHRKIFTTWTGLQILRFLPVGWTVSSVAIAPTAIEKVFNSIVPFRIVCLRWHLISSLQCPRSGQECNRLHNAIHDRRITNMSFLLHHHGYHFSQLTLLYINSMLSLLQ